MSNFTSGWVQYRARRETGDNRAMTRIREGKFRDFSIPQLFFVCRGRELCGSKIRMGLLSETSEV